MLFVTTWPNVPNVLAMYKYKNTKKIVKIYFMGINYWLIEVYIN